MRTFLIIIGLFLFIGNSFAQSYEEFIEKSYDFVDKGDLVSAEESLKAAMRKEPANPLNYALLTNLGTIQRRQGKLQDALVSYTSALSGHTKNTLRSNPQIPYKFSCAEAAFGMHPGGGLLLSGKKYFCRTYCKQIHNMLY